MNLRIFITLVNVFLTSNGALIPQGVKGCVELDTKLSLDWTVDLDKKFIKFNLTGETLGYIGFGLSPNDSPHPMTKADIVIGGWRDTKGYVEDRFSSGTFTPEMNEPQDWFLESAGQNGTWTFISFNRTLTTPDEKDLNITNDNMKVIWALGRTNELEQHDPGMMDFTWVNFLDPFCDTPTTDTTLPNSDTTTAFVTTTNIPNTTQPFQTSTRVSNPPEGDGENSNEGIMLIIIILLTALSFFLLGTITARMCRYYRQQPKQ